MRAPGSTLAGLFRRETFGELEPGEPFAHMVGNLPLIDAMRAIVYLTAEGIDLATHLVDDDARTAAKERVDLLIPVAKGWSSSASIAMRPEMMCRPPAKRSTEASSAARTPHM